MDTTDNVIDRAHLARAAGGDEALMAELLEMLRVELASRKRQLDACLERGEYEAAADAAHKLRGSGAYTGALALAGAAEHLEDCLRERDAPRIDRALRDLESRIDTVATALREPGRLTR